MRRQSGGGAAGRELGGSAAGRAGEEPAGREPAGDSARRGPAARGDAAGRGAPRLALALGLLLAFAPAAGCGGERLRVPEKEVPGGDPARGREHLARMACVVCHEIPGVRGADGTVGPPLTRFAKRSFIAGAVPNEPGNLVRWIMAPSSIEPGTAMPDLGVSREDARDIAAYLYTLR